ncbi:MAG: hypothetical protein WD077_13965 [Bacteroidia bacterium]
MKFSLQTLWIMLIGLCFISCNKSDIDRNKLLKSGSFFLESIFDYNQTRTEGIMYVSAFTGSDSDVTVYGLGANLYGDTADWSTPKNGGTLTLGNKQINTDSTQNYAYYYSAYHSNDPSLASNFGNTISFDISGNSTAGIPNISGSIYSPDLIFMTQPTGSLLDISSDFDIDWNSDAANPNNIFIIIEYLGSASQRQDPSLPGSNFYLIYETADDGSHTVNSLDLADFPVDGITQIHIVRGNTAIEEDASGEHKYEFLTYSKYRAEFIITE